MWVYYIWHNIYLTKHEHDTSTGQDMLVPMSHAGTNILKSRLAQAQVVNIFLGYTKHDTKRKRKMRSLF